MNFGVIEIKRIGLCMIVFLLSGCSISLIDRSPEPVLWKNLSLGQSRAEVRSLLKQRPDNLDPPLDESFIGTNEKTKKPGELIIDDYQFIDGYDKSLKDGRKFLYILGDIASLGLGEIILYPLELNMPQGQNCTAKAEFDSQDKLIHYVVKKDNGETLAEAGNINSPNLSCTTENPWCCAEQYPNRPDWCRPRDECDSSNPPFSCCSKITERTPKSWCCAKNNPNPPAWCSPPDKCSSSFPPFYCCYKETNRPPRSWCCTENNPDQPDWCKPPPPNLCASANPPFSCCYNKKNRPSTSWCCSEKNSRRPGWCPQPITPKTPGNTNGGMQDPIPPPSE